MFVFFNLAYVTFYFIVYSVKVDVFLLPKLLFILQYSHEDLLTRVSVTGGRNTLNLYLSKCSNTTLEILCYLHTTTEVLA